MPNFSDFAKQKLQERNNSSEAKLDLSKVTKILQDDLDRQIISQDSELREYYDFYKALDDNKSSYQQQYVGDNKATKQGELRDKTRKFFGQIKAKYPANQDAINLLEQDLTKKIAAGVDEQVALAVPYLMLQTITYFDQIDKIQDLEKKDHFLSQFPMRTEDEYACVGGFSTRLNPILMMLNAENVHLNSAHQSAVSSSNLNRGGSVHQQAMMNALFGINLKDEHYLLPAGRFTSQELWQGYLNYHVKLQEQFLSQQEQIEKDVTDLAILFDKGKDALNFSKNLKEKFSLKDTDFYKYDEDFMPIIDDEKVEAELEKRASSYYPKGIDLPIILQKNYAPIKDFNDFRTAEIIREILHNPTPSQSENSVALNYLWIMAVKEINNSGDILVLPKASEANLLQMLKSNANDEEIKSFFEKQEQQSLHALEQIASSDNSILSQDKLVLIKDKLVFAKVLGKKDLLLYAARNGYVSALDILLGDDKIDVNHASEKGGTALMFAAKNGHLEVVKELLAYKNENEKLLTDVNQANVNGHTALMIAAQNGHSEVVKELLAYKNKESGKNIDVNKADNGGHTALMRAAHQNRLEVVKELLADKDIDVNKANVNGHTALMFAAQNGHSEVVDKIVKKLCIDGVDPRDISYIARDRPKIFRDANKISSFANQICSFVAKDLNFSMAGQKKVELLVRKSLFEEMFADKNKENVDFITDNFTQNEAAKNVARTITQNLQSSEGVIEPSNSKLSLIPFNDPKTLNTEYEGIKDLVDFPIKEFINQVLTPKPNSIYIQSGVSLKSREVGGSRDVQSLG